MKRREHNEIRFSISGKKTARLQHLVGDMSVTTCGGGYILPVPCGAGKSTGIVSLVRLFAEEGFVIFVKTKAECRDMYERLQISGIAEAEMMMIYSPTKEELELAECCDNPFDVEYFKETTATKRAKEGYITMMERPAELTTKRVLIIPSQHLYTNYLPALFAYTNKKTPLDLHQYIGRTKDLLKSDDARKFIIIDEQPDFIQNFASFNGRLIASHFGVLSSKSSDIQVGQYYLHPEPLEMMKCRYENHLSSSRECFFFGRYCELNRLKSFEVLHHLHNNFEAIAKKESYTITNPLNDLISIRGMTSNIYLFDATADILSSYKTSNFKLITGGKSRYCSPIKFAPFSLDLKRWYKREKMSDSELSNKLDSVVDTLESQIKALDGEKLLIVTWKYMSIKGKDETLGIMSMLSDRLDTRGLKNLYSIIYRGSGEDKATNSYRDFAGVTFLGEWLVKGTLILLNKNYSIKSSGHKLRLTGMVQTICRVRIRRHDGAEIKVFYSEDIDRELMTDLQQYFKRHSDKGVRVGGVPIVEDSTRDDRFISEMRKLLRYDPALLQGIIDRKGYTLSIPLAKLVELLPKGNKERSSYRHFKTKLLTEYKIKLEIL